MKKLRSLTYMLIAIALMLYGLPRFQREGIESLSDGFFILWSMFAIIIIGAHLYEVLDGVEKRERRQAVRQYQLSRRSYNEIS